MIRDVARIKRFLAWRYELPLEDAESDLMVRVVGEVPDGKHIIPLGHNGENCLVTTRGGTIADIEPCEVDVKVLTA